MATETLVRVTRPLSVLVPANGRIPWRTYGRRSQSLALAAAGEWRQILSVSGGRRRCQVYFFNACSKPGAALARSSAFIAGCSSTLALKARNQGSATAGI